MAEVHADGGGEEVEDSEGASGDHAEHGDFFVVHVLAVLEEDEEGGGADDEAFYEVLNKPEESFFEVKSVRMTVHTFI